jgi:hypothetical protein
VVSLGLAGRKKAHRAMVLMLNTDKCAVKIKNWTHPKVYSVQVKAMQIMVFVPKMWDLYSFLQSH